MKILITTFFAISLIFTSLSASAGQWENIRIGVEGAYPPFSYVDADGELQGFDIDMAYALCEAMQAQCTLVQQDWDGLIPALMSRKTDAILASMSITEERKKAVNFTNKYYQTPARFVKRKDVDIDVSPEGLKGKVVGVQRATTFENYLTDNYADIVEIRRYSTQDEANLDLLAGRLNLLLADSVAISESLLKTDDGKDYEFVGPALLDSQWFGEGIGIALRKRDTDLLEKFNQAITAIRENGVYQQIQSKYFDFDVYGKE